MAQANGLLDLYEPIDTLKPVAEEIWVADGPVIMFGYLGMHLPFTTRMTAVRLADRSLWVHSPIALTARLKAEVDSLGPVRHLIAPNRIHYWWIGEWKRTYPEAIAYAAPGVRDRAGGSGAVFDRDLGAAPDPAWAGQIDQLFVPGSYLTEAVFFHRASRSLILTDLIQNFEPAKVRSPIFRFLVRLSGCADPDGKAPIDLRTTFLLKRAEVRRAVEKMLEWKPERVIFAHGRWYPAHGVEELRRAFRWTGVRK